MTHAMLKRAPVIRPVRVAIAGLTMLAVAFFVIFRVDGSSSAWSALRDTIANVIAAAIPSALIIWVCRRIPWHCGNRWWFFPVHLACMMGFGAFWYVSIAVTVGTSGWTTGGPWTPAWLSGPALHWELMTSAVLCFAVAGTCYAIEAIRDAQTAATLLQRAEVSALRAQLDPHLLFNTLHSLLELVRSGDARAGDAIDQFARMARYVTDGRRTNRDVVPLAEEWAMTQDYVALERLRLGPRLTCTFTLDDTARHVGIPALSLQPLVENAIRHGIAPRPGAGSIAVTAQRDGADVVLSIVDDGLGAAAATRGTGSGLDLVRRRFVAQFGERARFSAAARSDCAGWQVVARFPATALA
jgi:Histidine kinase